ncbi:hypothetical protein NT6N_24860 [Oceaniferula spumae]|uniref:Uncharacterized protein n=1 Tax=Oceaniferula spumae TaxID=2979115 RepID=A0AAT9FN77_9BACT
MKTHKKGFFFYAGLITFAFGMARFYYLDVSADARITERAKGIERTYMDNNSITDDPRVKASITVGMVTRMAIDEVKNMFWPFLLVINGASFLFIHERKKVAEQGASSDAIPSVSQKPL